MNRRFVVCTAFLFAGLTAGVPAQPKVEEFPLGPCAPNRTAPGFSKDGLHLALTVPQGRKSVIMVDGVEGPRFDNVVNQLVFFPDGKAVVTVGHTPAESILLMTGKAGSRAIQPDWRHWRRAQAYRITASAHHTLARAIAGVEAATRAARQQK
jgi:hypothetical protein